MEEEYDVIVLGTGLTECIISGLLSANKKKVLHMDKNSYYGAESASLSLEQLWRKFATGSANPDAKDDNTDLKIPASFGRSRDYNIDVCPKFIMACGNLVKILLQTQVTKYLEFRSVQGSFVMKGGSIHKVPSTATEAASSGLMGWIQKHRFKNFVNWVNGYDFEDQKTWDSLDVTKKTAQEVFDYFNLDENTIAFTGHALALHLDDTYLSQPAADLVKRVKLYAYSMSRYGNSPYIYPRWGLGGLPEGFSRISAVHGGIFMLNKPADEIIYDDDGKVKGVKSQGQIAYCKQLVADPTYFIGTEKVKQTGQIARCICILSHAIPNTNDADSCQIILPSKHLDNHKSDLYIACESYHHEVAPEGKWIAVVSGLVETKDPHAELVPALKLLGKIDKEFFFVSDVYEPTGDGSNDNIFISRSYDQTSHFETTTDDVMDIWKRLTGVDIDLTRSAEPEDLEQQ